MIRPLTLLLALPLLGVAAELDVYTVVNSVETPVPAVVDLGSAPAGDLLQMRFRLRNSADATITLSKLLVLGTGFSMYGSPSLPYEVAPGSNVDFLVRFTAPSYGSYSANLTVNSRSLLVRAAAPPALTVGIDGTPVSAGSTIDFGKIERGSQATRFLTLQNPTPSTLTVSRLEISGADFSVTGPPVPVQVRPGQSAVFELICRPAKAGLVNGSLAIDNRSFPLTAFAAEPKPPRPTLRLSSAVIGSAQQVQVEVLLSEASRAIVTGQVSLELQGGAKDDALLFINSGKPSLDFGVHVGDTQVTFNSATYATFQTGTTAGTLVVKVEMGGYTDQATIEIAPAVVTLDSARATRESSGLVVQMTGFDNTRSFSQMVFTFYGSNGNPLASAPVRVEVTNDFRNYYATSTLGGAFALKAVFPVTGNATEVSGVELEMQNSAGITHSERLRF